MVNIFATYAPLYLLQFFLEAVGGIAETFKNTTYRRHIVIIFLYTLLISLGSFPFVLLRIGRYEQFIGIRRYGKAVIFVDRDHQRGTKTQVGRDEFAVIIAAKRNFTADIRYVHAQSKLTFAASEVQIILIVERNIGGKSRSGGGISRIIVG